MYPQTGLMVLYHRAIMVWVKTGVADYGYYGSPDVPGSINCVMRYTGDHPLLLHLCHKRLWCVCVCVCVREMESVARSCFSTQGSEEEKGGVVE